MVIVRIENKLIKKLEKLCPECCSVEQGEQSFYAL